MDVHPAQDPAADTPSPARPILASALLEGLLRQHEQRAGGHVAGRFRTGIAELDDYVLLGGVERGVVLGVSSEEEVGVGRLISLHLLATVLLDSPTAKASIIDTTGSFPISLLAKIIRHRLVSPNYINKHSTQSVLGLDEKVPEVLGRVAISRVFDIEGVWEVLSEISQDCQKHLKGKEDVRSAEETEKNLNMVLDDEGEKRMVSDRQTIYVEESAEKEIEIVDSEEDDDTDLDFKATDSLGGKTGTEAPKIEIAQKNPITSNTETSDTASTANLRKNSGKMEIILIDNTTTLINDLFSRRERTAAHALIRSFTRTLHSLCQTNSILTILLNSLIDPNPAASNPSYRPSALNTKPGVSIFTSTTSRPALGKIFSDMLALHLMVTRVPRTKADADILFASPSSSSPALPPTGDEAGSASRSSHAAAWQSGPEMSHVVEVLKDTAPDLDYWIDQTPQHHNANSKPSKSQPQRRRRKTRTQRWAPFDLSANKLRLIPFATGPGRKPGTTPSIRTQEGDGGNDPEQRDRMNLAKQFPFGRRV